MPKHEVPRDRYDEVVRYLQSDAPQGATASYQALHIADVFGLEIAPSLPEPGEMVEDAAMLNRLPVGTLLCSQDKTGARVYVELGADTTNLLFFYVMADGEREYHLSHHLPARVVEYPA